jgi:hypothetical protein
VEAVGSISEQLAKIDRFARMPSAEPEAKPKPKREAPLDPGGGGAAAPPQPAAEPAAGASPPAGAGAEAPDAAGKL